MMLAGEYKPRINYEALSPEAALSIPTLDHSHTLLYVLAISQQAEDLTFTVQGMDGGSISMLAVQIGSSPRDIYAHC